MSTLLPIRTPSFEAAVALANEYLADTNAADFAGIAYTGYIIFETEGLYANLYEVVFTAPFDAASFAQAA
jgi:hypothetical protein